jgi:hypothetical protein
MTEGMSGAELTRHLLRAKISREEFEQAMQFLQKYEEVNHEECVLRRALLVGAVVAYGRPFSRNERAADAPASSRLSATPNEILTNETERDLHEQVLSIRNKAVAHAEWSKYPVGLIRSEPDGFLLQSMPFEILGTLNVDVFRRIAQRMERYCVTVMCNLNNRLAEPTPSA